MKYKTKRGEKLCLEKRKKTKKQKNKQEIKSFSNKPIT